jgi:glycosyltransferase involved in cell wall biosynthesis
MHGAVFRELSRFRPDAVVSYGYERWPMMGALLWAFCGQIPVLLRNDANAIQPFRGFRKWRRRCLAHCLDSQRMGALVIGRSNTRYWTEQMSLPADRLFWAPYSVDNAYFERESARWRPERETVKTRWRVGGRRVVLFVGRLEKVKGLSCLLRAYLRLRKHRSDVALVLAGEGSLRAWVERVVSEEGIPDVVLTGFMQQDEIPQAYAAADVFVLPSEEEPWGLVVNEAMASGLPVVVSDRVGAWVDLVRDGENGYVIPAGDAAALAEAMERVLSGDARAMGERSRQVVKSHSVEHEARGFIEAFQAVEEGRL